MCRQPKPIFFRGGGCWKRPMPVDFLGFSAAAAAVGRYTCGCYCCIRCALWSRNGCDLVGHCQRAHYLLLNIILIIVHWLSTNSGRSRWTRKNSLRNALRCDAIWSSCSPVHGPWTSAKCEHMVSIAALLAAHWSWSEWLQMVSKLSTRLAHRFNIPKHKPEPKPNSPKTKLFPQNSLLFKLTHWFTATYIN